MNHHNSLFDEGVTWNKLAEYRHNNSDDATSAKTSSTYAELVEEVEKSSELLLNTQSKLYQIQEEAKISNKRIDLLEEKLSAKEKEVTRLRGENSLLLDEGQTLRDEIKRMNQDIVQRDAARTRPELEQRLRKAVELLKKDLATSKEKQQAAEQEAGSKCGLLKQLEAENKNLKQFLSQMEKKDKESKDKLNTCKSQLRQATEESTLMVEEVAELRNELKRTKKLSEEKESILRRDITEKVKEKIRLEVRETVTKQVTEKVSRQVRAEMKAEREKEINSLREQFKKIFKENAQLKEKLNNSEAAVEKSKKLEEVIPDLKDEISRLLQMLDTVKKDQELAVSELESYYRKKLQTIKEESAKEKWAHASELRKQLSKERDREVNEFTERIEALSKQTDRLLQSAEKEKEVYANQIKKRIIEEKDREIETLKEKLTIRTQENDELLFEATKDKEAYAEQLRQQLEEEKRREIYKYTYRIEALTSEKETLQQRIDAFDEELAWAWKESEEKSEQLKESQADLKILEDDIFKLKRKNQNLGTLVERYKQDLDELSSEYNKAKIEFKNALVKSEEQNHCLKEKLKQAESMLSEIRNISTSETHNEPQDILVERTKRFEEEISRLKKENENLSASVAQLEHERENPAHSELLEENDILREKVDNLTSLVHNLRRESLEIEMTRLKDDKKNDKMSKGSLQIIMNDTIDSTGRTGTQGTSLLGNGQETTNEIDQKEKLEDIMAQNSVLHEEVFELNTMLENYKRRHATISEDLNRKNQEYQSSLKTLQEKIDVLKEQLAHATGLVDQYRLEKAEATRELERSKQNAEDALTVASEDDTAQLNIEIQTLERLLDRYKATSAELLNEEEASKVEVQKSLLISEEQTRLKQEVGSETTQVGTKKTTQADEKQQKTHPEFLSIGDEKCAALQKQVEDLNYLLDKYRNELSQTSQELERSKQVLASEGEEAQRLQKRVESLNLLLETTEANHAKNSREFEASKKRLTDATIASNEVIANLQLEIIDLKRTLSQQQFEHDHTVVNEKQIIEQLERELAAVTTNCVEATRRSNELNQALAECQSEYDNHIKFSQKEKEKFEKEILGLRMKYADALKRSDDLNQTMAKRQSEYDSYIANENKQREKVERELFQLRAKHVEVQKTCENLQQTIAKRQSEYDISNKEVNEEKENLEIELSILKADYVQAKNRIDELNGAIGKLHNEFENSKINERIEKERQAKEHAVLKNKYNEAQSTINELNRVMTKRQIEFNNRVESESEERQRVEMELAEVTAKYTEALARADQTEADFQNFMVEHGEAQNRAERFECELKKYLTEDGEANKRADQLESKLKDFMAKYAEAQRRADNLKTELQKHYTYDNEAKIRADKLESELKHFTTKYSEAQRRIDELKAELQVLHSTDSEAKSKVERLESELKHFMTKHAEAQRRADDLKNELQKYHSSDSEAKSRADNLEIELKDSIAKYDEVSNRADDLNASLQKCRNQKNEATQRANELERKLEDFVAKNADAERRADALEGELQKYRVEEDNRKFKAVELERELDDLKSKHAEAQGNAEHLKLELQNITKIHKGGQGRVALAEMQKLRNEYDEVSKELKHSKRLFKEELVKSENQIFDLKKKLSQAQALIDNNQVDYLKYTEELVETKRQLEVALVTSESHARNKAKELETLIKDIRNENHNLHKQLQDMEDKAGAENETLREKVKDLKLLLEASRVENDRTKEDLQHSIDLFKEALAAWRDESKTLNEELKNLRQNSGRGSSHARALVLAGSQHSRSPINSTSFTQQGTTSSISSDALYDDEARPGDEKQGRVFVENEVFDDRDKSSSSRKSISSDDLDELNSTELQDAENNSSVSPLHSSLVNKWRRETHQLIEEVEAAHEQRRRHGKDSSGHDGMIISGKKRVSFQNKAFWDGGTFPGTSKPTNKQGVLDGISKSSTRVADNDASSVSSKSSTASETIHCDEENMLIQVQNVDSDSLQYRSSEKRVDDDHSDTESIDSDEAMLREKLGNRLEEWNRTLENFSSSILRDNVPYNAENRPKKASDYGSADNNVSTRSEISILRNSMGVTNTGSSVKKSVTWNDTVEELSFVSEVVILGETVEDEVESNQDSRSNSSFGFEHQFEVESEVDPEEQDSSESEATARETREPPLVQSGIQNDEGESRDEVSTLLGESRESLGAIDYSWSTSSHTATNAIVSFKACEIDEDLQERVSGKTYEDDSTLDWHLQSAGECSTTSSRFETSDSSHHLDDGSERVHLDDGKKYHHHQHSRKDDDQSESNDIIMTASLPAEDSVILGSSCCTKDSNKKSIQECQVSIHGGAILPKISQSSSSSSHSGRKQKTVSPSGEVTENLGDEIIGSKGDTKNGEMNVAISSSSSSSMTSSSCPSSFSTSFSSSNSSHSNRRKNSSVPNEKPQSKSKSLVPVGEKQEDATENSSGRSSMEQKSGVQRALEQSSRRTWTKKDIRRFMKKKHARKKKASELTQEDATKNQQSNNGYKDIISQSPSQAEDAVSTAMTSEMDATANTDQAQIVPLESRE